LRVNEIFHSVQGEGTRAGVPCAFIRLTGCHLRCVWCDTEYAFNEGAWMTLAEILERVRAFKCRTVEVTGGEPLLQPDVYPLMDRLLAEYETVLLETSGAVSIARVDPRVVRIVDFKCPSSGEAERNDWSNVRLLTPRDEVKFVIGSREDYEFARYAVSRHDLPARCTVLFSPVVPSDREPQPGVQSLPVGEEAAAAGEAGGPNDTEFGPAMLAGWLLEDGLDVRVSLQLHKIIWPAATRGV
jgi:7-carboxy-7-deazaguanine synthase